MTRCMLSLQSTKSHGHEWILLMTLKKVSYAFTIFYSEMPSRLKGFALRSSLSSRAKLVDPFRLSG